MMNSSSMPGRAAIAGCAAVIAGVTVLASSADARMSVIYEPRVGHQALLGYAQGNPGLTNPRALTNEDWVYQQQPGGTFLNGRARQAAKVVGTGSGTLQSPTIDGKTAAEIVALLEAQMARDNYNGLVFIDELRPNFRGQGASELLAAMRILATKEPTLGSDGRREEHRARQVHIYVPAPELSVAAPEDWAAAWEIMSLSGGVWLEAYRKRPGNRLVWRPEEWLTYGRTFPAQFEARGGDPTRVHFVMSSPERASEIGAPLPGEPTTQNAQWQWARTGDACSTLANGPGTWRVAADDGQKPQILAANRANPFLTEFRAVFGNDSAPEGTQDIAAACLPEPVVHPARAAALAGAISSAPGPLPATVTTDAPVAVGAKSGPVRVDLGADPGGFAAALGLDPVDFWFSPRTRSAAQIVLRDDDGQRGVARLGGRGKATIAGFTATRAGTANLNLTIPAWKLQGAVSEHPVDVAQALEPHRAQLGDLVDRIARRPNDWRLIIPLAATVEIGAAGTQTETSKVDAIQTIAVPPHRVRARWKRDPRRYEVTRIVGTRAGLPASLAKLTVTRSGGRVVPVTLPVNGVHFLLSRRSGETISIAGDGLATPAVHRIASRAVASAIGVRQLGRVAIRREGRDPKRWRRIAILVKARSGGTVPLQPLRVRYGRRGLKKLRTDSSGRARAWIPQAARGTLNIRTEDSPRVFARRRLR